jgi:hypothetical protein
MRRLGLLGVLFCVFIMACNLSTQSGSPLPTDENLPPTRTFAPVFTVVGATPTPLLPVLPPLPGTPGGDCQIYTTYSGSDPNNRISLRAEPSSTSTQLFRLPNNTDVFLVPGSQEVEAEGYHWLNIIYIDTQQQRYQGWAARDSFSRGGVRDPSIATLRATSRRGPC